MTSASVPSVTSVPSVNIFWLFGLVGIHRLSHISRELDCCNQLSLPGCHRPLCRLSQLVAFALYGVLNAGKLLLKIYRRGFVVGLRMD